MAAKSRAGREVSHTGDDGAERGSQSTGGGGGVTGGETGDGTACGSGGGADGEAAGGRERESATTLSFPGV